MRPMSRVGLFAATLAVSAAAQTSSSRTVAGVEIPQTPLAIKAEQYVRGVEPGFLFNHSVRTYVFGASRLKSAGIAFNPEAAYVAALFHDLGMVPTVASPNASFEVDGANRAEAFVKANGGTPQEGRVVWNAIVTHDLPSAYQAHQSAEAVLVGVGAASDVVGYGPKAFAPGTVEEVLKAYPRLQFKTRFVAYMTDHCRRKPASQIGWLDRLCRKVAPNVDRGSVEKEVAAAPFAE